MDKRLELEQKAIKNINNLSPEQKRQLALITKNPKLLRILAKDKDKEVQKRVAKNKYCEAQTLEQLRNSTNITISNNACHTMRMKLVSTEYQKKELNEKLLDVIKEDERIKQLVKDDEMKTLYEGSFPQNEQEYNRLNSKLKEFYPEKREMTEYMMALEQGMILGSMLEGAWDSAFDLQVALRTGRDVDGIDIPNNTPEEINRNYIKDDDRVR